MVEFKSNLITEPMLAHLAIRAGNIPIREEDKNRDFELKVVVTIGKRKLDSKCYKVDNSNHGIKLIKFSDKFTK